jgi:sec-independent protein translocase protein TatA
MSGGAERNMGLGGISIWQLLIILVIVLLIFGTKRLKGIGGDLGNAIKSFRSAMGGNDKEDEAEPKQLDQDPARRTVDTDPARAATPAPGAAAPTDRPKS